MYFQELLNNTLDVHKGLPNEALCFIDKHVNDNSRTLEIGAGFSTLLFALKGCNHICIDPDEGLVNRIRRNLVRYNISIQKINFQIDRSENVLPHLDVTNLDLVIIDGRHASPTPFIDWYYTAPKVKIGGILIIDDTHLWTGATLREFLISEQEWSLKKDFSGKTSMFVKLKEGSHSKEWTSQIYVLSKSRKLQRMRSIKLTIELLRSGKFRELRKIFRDYKYYRKYC